MKNNFFFWVLLCSVMTIFAQIYAKQGDKVVATDVDSVTYSVPASVVSEGALPGLFSVSAEKQVCFSMGNLQYTQSTGTWSFAEQQYEFIGTDNVTGGSVSHDSTSGDSKSGTALANKIDLFGWSGSTNIAKWGISTSWDSEDYSGDFADWGQNAINNGGNRVNQWRTLTYEEWSYLLNTRANASMLKGVARINLNADGSEYANGFILLPDNWTAPIGVSFKSGFASEYTVQAYADYQTLTLPLWQTLEKSGAVFLPASGYRDGTDVYYVGRIGFCWSATPDNNRLHFSSGEALMCYSPRRDGQAVRLVRDAK